MRFISYLCHEGFTESQLTCLMCIIPSASHQSKFIFTPILLAFKMPYIFYSGIGAKESEIHSIEEFLNIMKKASFHYYGMISLGFDMEMDRVYRCYNNSEW